MGAILYKKIHTKVLLLIGAIITVGGVFIASFMKDEVDFIKYYGLMFGCGIGLMYFTPLMAGWEWFPDRKGMVSGIIIGGFGFGSFIFGLIAMELVNPENKDPIKVQDGDPLFEKEIAERVPFMLRTLCLIWVILISLGILMIRRNP